MSVAVFVRDAFHLDLGEGAFAEGRLAVNNLYLIDT